MRQATTEQGRAKMDLVKLAQAAGWRVRETREGIWLMHPDGKTTVATHPRRGGNSSVRRFRADLRRAGLDV